jgi:hypothetical protein
VAEERACVTVGQLHDGELHSRAGAGPVHAISGRIIHRRQPSEHSIDIFRLKPSPDLCFDFGSYSRHVRPTIACSAAARKRRPLQHVVSRHGAQI